MHRKIILITLITLAASSLTQCGCKEGSSESAPLLSDLVISSTDATSIKLAQPTFSKSGDPAPSIAAYIGVDGTISVSGSTVTGSFQGPVDLSQGGEYTFNGLSYNTLYRIVVVARNSKGYSVKEIAQSTGEVRPVMNDLVITGTSTTTISIAQPTFSTAGNPLPTVSAYIGIDGGISVTGSIVKGSLQGPIDVSAGGHTFTGLNFGTIYRIIVVAENIIGSNISGYSVKQITKGIDSTTAQRVYGQYGSFTSSGKNIGPGALYMPQYLAVVADGIYVVDFNNHRVLYYSGTSTTATRVYGQGGSFTSNSANNGGVSEDSLNNPRDMEIVSGGLYIADSDNYRVLYFPGTSTTAARVYGQGGVFTSASYNKGGVSADSLTQVFSVSAGSTGIYATDLGNSRVLYFEGASTTATAVYGQGGDFASNASNNGGISAVSLNCPMGVAFYGGSLYISDSLNHRVLYYTGTGTTATRVYGQNGSFTSNTMNSDGVTADILRMPYGIAADDIGVYISDTLNHRVLYYEGTDTTAVRVYGQNGSFTSNGANTGGGASAGTLNAPRGVAVDTGGVYIADYMNNRVLYYEGAGTTATRVYGQGGSFTTGSSNNGGISAGSLYSPTAVAVDSSGVYIVDSNNNRVLYYNGADTTASRVYGQGGSFTTGSSNNGGISADSLNFPWGVAVYGGYVYIADSNNHRVLCYSGTDTTAVRVYGQVGSFTTGSSNSGGVSADSLYSPCAVYADMNGVYVADMYNHRVLYYPGTVITASRVYGQSGSFTTNTANNGGVSADSLYYPYSLHVGTSGLFIADTYNNRVLWY